MTTVDFRPTSCFASILICTIATYQTVLHTRHKAPITSHGRWAATCQKSFVDFDGTGDSSHITIKVDACQFAFNRRHSSLTISGKHSPVPLSTMLRTLIVLSTASTITMAFVPYRQDARAPVQLSSMQLRAQGSPVDRFFRVFRSNVNKLVSNMEDPEKVIVQAVSDMQVSHCCICKKMQSFSSIISNTFLV